MKTTPADHGFVTINVRPEARAALQRIALQLTGERAGRVTLSAALEALAATADLEQCTQWLETRR